ncbi:hypothetical protein [Nonlabens xiamenensis]|uniref:hypothetical protein n=1 Tax=Nonlabens xiamenensis TaxID=2341043 RepID=UPI00198114B3|nr:hypothetical protein [Nonlabens xiamenensis]
MREHNMNKFIATAVGLSLGVATCAMAKPTKGFFTYDAMGCMLLKECTEDVERVYSTRDLKKRFPYQSWDPVQYEFDSMVNSLEKLGIHVHIASPKYFPPGHRGVYHTVSNHFYLNEAYVSRPHVLMAVVRHEGWHAAQDCMAGTLDNTFLAIIMDEEKVPDLWADMATKTYFQNPKAIPWEKEAFWAGHTEGMTQKALEVCASGKPMWEVYQPTPLTKKWLKENNYIKE